MNKTILVTGGAGFIGSNFIKNYLQNNPHHQVINLDKLTYAGNLANLTELEANPQYTFIKGDICDRDLIENILSAKNAYNAPPDYIIHFAAESHVDRSIHDSSEFIQTNIIGTQVILDAVRKLWTGDKNKRMVHVSTDEVYGSLPAEGLFSENSLIKPNSPYSASKASSDLLVRAYFKTYGLPLITTRCSNNYGPYQFPEKLIPLIINNIIKRKKLPVYGQGSNVRDWLYVTDHCNAIEAVLNKGIIGEVYNIGGNNEWKNIDIVKRICSILDKKLGQSGFKSESLIEYVSDRLGHDLRYAIDASKIKEQLGWKPQYVFEDGIEKTIDWYLDNMDWLDDVTSGEYQAYYQKHYTKNKT